MTLAGESRNTTAPMMSSTCITRPSGMERTTRSRNFGSCSTGRVSGVSTKPGQMAFTRMPFGPSSKAIAFVIPSTACLVAV